MSMNYRRMTHDGNKYNKSFESELYMNRIDREISFLMSLKDDEFIQVIEKYNRIIEPFKCIA